MKTAINNLAGILNKLFSGIAVLSYLLLQSHSASAETVEDKLTTGLIVTANFHSGVSSQPAVLLLHGFLQTHNSEPMNSLASHLASKGYTVLAPTISLGINKRSQTMACEAVHTHTMETEVAEVSHWVDWLFKKGYKNIVTIGFSSTGNLQALLYNSHGSHPSIKNSILISPNPLSSNKSDLQKPHTTPDKNPNSTYKKPRIYSLGYCKNNFAATSNTYLSYSKYDSNKLLELIHQTPVQTEIILGSDDTILPANWSTQIRALKAQTHVTVIDKANHFFDGTYEFDLAEKVEDSLKNISVR